MINWFVFGLPDVDVGPSPMRLHLWHPDLCGRQACPSWVRSQSAEIKDKRRAQRGWHMGKPGLHLITIASVSSKSNPGFDLQITAQHHTPNHNQQRFLPVDTYSTAQGLCTTMTPFPCPSRHCFYVCSSSYSTVSPCICLYSMWTKPHVSWSMCSQHEAKLTTASSPLVFEVREIKWWMHSIKVCKDNLWCIQSSTLSCLSFDVLLKNVFKHFICWK